MDGGKEVDRERKREREREREKRERERERERERGRGGGCEIQRNVEEGRLLKYRRRGRGGGEDGINEKKTISSLVYSIIGAGCCHYIYNVSLFIPKKIAIMFALIFVKAT